MVREDEETTGGDCGGREDSDDDETTGSGCDGDVAGAITKK